MRRWLVLLALLCVLPAYAETDDALAAAKGVVPPAVWCTLPPTPPRVLAVRGLWHAYYGVERALARLGGALETDCWHSPKSVRFYPETYEELMTFHLVVVDNINADAFGPTRRAMLKTYVANGGAVLFLGGFYGYQGYHGTALEELAPVTFPEKDGLLQAPDGLRLHTDPDCPDTRVYWYHPVMPKADARVLVTADGRPLLITGTYGKGRVAVFAGSVMGDPPAGQTPFWAWNGWTGVLTSTLTWLLAPAKADTEAYRGAVSAALAAAHGKREAEKAVLLKYARLCGDRAAARLLVETAAEGADDISWDEVGAIDAGVAAYLDASFAPLVARLIASEQTHKASLGLRLLGGTRSKDAAKTLADALDAGDVGDGGGDGLDNPGGLQQDPTYRAYALRVGTLEGIGRLGDPALLPAVRKFRDEIVKSASRPESHPASLLPEDELYQEAVIASLRCGDTAAAGAAVDVLLANRYLFIQLAAILDEQMQEPNEQQILAKKRAAAAIPHQALRLTQLPQRVVGVPDAVLVALAQRIAVEKDAKVAELAMVIFGANTNPGRHWPAGVGEALQKSPLPAVAELGAGMR